jgi:hypothetical protein
MSRVAFRVFPAGRAGDMRAAICAISCFVSRFRVCVYVVLATAVALEWLAGAATRLTAAATCLAKRGPVNRAHSAHSSTLKERLGPKSTVFRAFRLDSARCKLAFTSSERRFHAF